MFFLQPTEDEQKKKEEKVKDILEYKLEGEAAKQETKEVQTNEVKMEKSSQKVIKKTKNIPCKVALLDGTEYSCDLEVSQGADEKNITWFVKENQLE